MKDLLRFPLSVCLLVLCTAVGLAQEQPKPTTATTASVPITHAITLEDTRIPANSRIYVAEMEGFDAYFIAALRKKSVPLLVVNDRSQADFEVTGSSDTKKAGWAKTIFGSGRSEESASIKIVNLRTGVIVYADSSHRGDAARGKRSTAEKLAKYLGKKIKDDEKKMSKS
ncbi:MAG: hypothetical protein QOF61_765 [Acidobacteriota bacterium]|jgi:hypothetical protein|nr:hypothetical protein [Acidobacteriota bacterium]